MIGSITMLSLFSIHFINLSGGEVDGEGLTVLLAGDDEAAGQVLAPAAPTIPFLKIWLEMNSRTLTTTSAKLFS